MLKSRTVRKLTRVTVAIVLTSLLSWAVLNTSSKHQKVQIVLLSAIAGLATEASLFWSFSKYRKLLPGEPETVIVGIPQDEPIQIEWTQEELDEVFDNEPILTVWRISKLAIYDGKSRVVHEIVSNHDYMPAKVHSLNGDKPLRDAIARYLDGFEIGYIDFGIELPDEIDEFWKFRKYILQSDRKQRLAKTPVEV